MTNLEQVVEYIRSVKDQNPGITKADLTTAYVERFRPAKSRSVYQGADYAVRFCEAQTDGFSNTVLSLSALHKYDTKPFVIVVNRRDRVDFLLANSTFLKKISHSSRDLRIDNVRGSFNGTDILDRYEQVENRAANFPTLFTMHEPFSWDENLERLVEATNAIVGRDARFRPSAQELDVLLNAPARMAHAVATQSYAAIVTELQTAVAVGKDAILAAAQLDNVNLRGNAIEQIITGGGNEHALGDILYNVNGPLAIDVKTKLLNRASAPKAYNVDKLLRFLATPGSTFFFYFVSVDVGRGLVKAQLIPVLDRAVLAMTNVQHHWAGRVSRGVTQLSGLFNTLEIGQHETVIDERMAGAFLQELINL
jgi:hypothetical protein